METAIRRVEGPKIAYENRKFLDPGLRKNQGTVYHFIDDETQRLDSEYSASTYRGHLPTSEDIAASLRPFFEAAKLAGHILGFDQDGFRNFAEQQLGAGGGFPLYSEEYVVKSGYLRHATFDGVDLYFPTEKSIRISLRKKT